MSKIENGTDNMDILNETSSIMCVYIYIYICACQIAQTNAVFFSLTMTV